MTVGVPGLPSFYLLKDVVIHVYILIAIFFRLLSTCLPAIVALVLHVFLSPLAFAIMCKNDSYDFPLAL